MKVFKIFLLIFFILIFLFIIVIPFTLLVFGIQSKPLVTPGKKLSYEDVARVKQLIKDNDPRKPKPGDIRNTSITERDLNLFLDYALSQTPGNQKMYAHVNLYQNLANAQFTYLLPENPFGDYLNISTMLVPESNRLTVGQLKIGSLRIPGWSINFVTGILNKLLMPFEEYRNMIELADSIKDMQVDENKVSVVYQWQPDVIKRLHARGRDFLLPADERELLRVYNEKLAAISRSLHGRTVSISLFVRPLFQFAKQRTISGGNPEAENRALVLNLAAYSIGRNINRFIDIGNAESYPLKGRVKLTLLGRDDLAKHFLVSAAITVSAGSGLANLAGVFKEMDDSRGGSGFSFADLAADRAGVRFAEIASGSSRQAKLLQQSMAGLIREYDFMPRVDNLPEGIQELEFKRRYKDLDSETYRIVEDEIDRRIAACQIYQLM
ncbi:MAG: hypothetical protein JSW07_05375 [bacterium]|nr:MAG: hypothetical protein JSW07_05375 [bacterium]